MRNPFEPFNRRRAKREVAALPAPAAEPSLEPDPSLPGQPEEPDSGPNPDHAWKALALVNEWIRHADAKAGVTLAFTGVLGTMTFNLVKDFGSRSCGFDLLVIATCFLLVTTGALCGWTLTPRYKDNDVEKDVVNRLFYASINKSFKGKRRQYGDVMHTLTADPVELTRDLSDQIHANAKVATTKNLWVKWAIRAALLSGVAVTAIAIVIGVTNT